MKSINDIKDLILKYELPYRSINGTEASLLYEVYNNTFSSNKKDIGCGECREEILRDLYLYYKNNLLNES